MGKGQDRGAREPIKPITPTLVFPVKGKEFSALATLGFYNSAASKPIFKKGEI
jgi:hypothetical protein